MKTLNILLLLSAMVLAYACYDDKGSDSYVGRLDIRVENVDQDMKVEVAGLLQVRPEIFPEDREYRCFWGIAPKGNNWAVIDTISHERDLDLKADLNIGSYTLRFYAEDVATGVFSYTEYNLAVETDMAAGWWLLKDGEKGTDVDLFTPDGMIPDVICSRNGRALQGEAVDMTYTDWFWTFDRELGENVRANAVYVAGREDMVTLDLFTGKIISSYKDLFFEQPEGSIKCLFRSNNTTHVVVGERLYSMPNSKYDKYRQFAVKHLGDYRLSVCRSSCSWSTPLLFDEASSSFCSAESRLPELNYLGNNTSPAPHRDLDMDLLFVGARTTSIYNPGQEAYAILKEKGAEAYSLAHLNGTPRGSRTPMLDAFVPLSPDLGVVKASCRAMNQDNDIIYFYDGKGIASYNIATATETEQPVQFKAGEKVTFMDYVKYNPWGLEDDWFTYLVIATAQGGSYKVYLHPVQAGNIRPAVKVLEGKGEVKRAIYLEMKNGVVNQSTYF